MVRIICVFLILFLSSCQKKYIANFKKEGTGYIKTYYSLPESKVITAKDDTTAYRKAVEMVIELEKNNDNLDFAYSGISLFYEKDKSYAKIDDQIKKDIETRLGIDYLQKSMRKKTITKNPPKSLIMDQYNRQEKDKFNFEKFRVRPKTN